MINLPTQSELDELKSFSEIMCLSVYVSYVEPSGATNPNRIKLKNLLQEAEVALLAKGMDSKAVARTLNPARSLTDQQEFWPVHHESLALFIHQKFFRYYHIPQHDKPSELTIQRGFKLDIIESLLQQNSQYLVLALSHNDVRLYEGDRYQLNKVPLKNLPKDMVKALNIDEHPKWHETHTIAPAHKGKHKGSEAYHGQYNIAQTDKDMLLNFFRLIDKRIRDYTQKKQLPLIVAGVEYLIPIFRQATTVPNLVESSIKGNIEHSSAESIRKQAWLILEQSKSR